jgi:hypothetical protein
VASTGEGGGASGLSEHGVQALTQRAAALNVGKVGPAVWKLKQKCIIVAVDHLLVHGADRRCGCGLSPKKCAGLWQVPQHRVRMNQQ